MLGYFKIFHKNILQRDFAKEKEEKQKLYCNNGQRAKVSEALIMGGKAMSRVVGGRGGLHK